MPFYEYAEDSPNYHSNLMCSATSCKKIISQKQPIFMCSSCQKIYHPPCKGIIGSAKIKKAAESNWVCSVDCAKTSNLNPGSLNTPPTATIMTTGSNFESAINTLSSRIDSQFTEIKAMIFDIQKSQEFICNEFDTIRVECKNIVAENAALTSKCEHLEKSYLKLHDRLNLMEAQLDIPLQREFEKNIIICGLAVDVPDIDNFILDSLQRVCSNAVITKIQKMHHNPKSKSMLRDSFIITLNSIEVKNTILSKFKMVQKNSPSSSKHPGCYVMNHFTKYQSKLYNEAKKLQRAHNFKYLWAKYGKIFLRKTADSTVHHIFSMNDIFRLDETSSPQHTSPNDDSSDK